MKFTNLLRRSVVWSALLVLAATSCSTQTNSGSSDAERPTASSPAPTPELTSRPSPASPPPTATTSTPPAPRTKAEQAELDRLLRDAAWDNEVDRAARLIDRGADVNAKDETEQSAYLITTSEGYVDLLRLTLANGAKINDKDSFNGTGLIRAAERGHALVVGELLQAGIQRDHVNRLGYQAIHEAVWLGEATTSYVDTIRALAAGGVRLDRASDRQGLTPLQMAEQKGYGRLEDALRGVLDPGRVTDPDATLLRSARVGDADLAARAIRGGPR